MDEDVRELFQRVSANEKALAAIPFIREDVGEIKNDCSATRRWVDAQLREKEERAIRRDELTTGQKIAVIGAVAVIFASIVSAVAGLISAGVFG